MHGSSIQVVGVEIVDAFTARRSLLYVVMAGEVDLGVPFHDLSDASSQVLQQAYDIIDVICFHQLSAISVIILAHAIHEYLLQLVLGKSLIYANAHDVLSPFPCQGHEATLTMIVLHRHFQKPSMPSVVL